MKCIGYYKFTKSQRITHVLYMNNIEHFEKLKRTEDSDTNTEIYSEEIRIEFGIEEIFKAHNKEWKKKNNRGHRTAKLRKILCRKGKLEILGNS